MLRISIESVDYKFESHPLNIEWYRGGTSALIGMGQEDDVVQFSASTPYDRDTLSQVGAFDPEKDFDGNKLSDVKLVNGTAEMTVMNNDGSTNDFQLYHYELTSPGDVTTAELVDTFDFSAQTSNAQGHAIGPNGQTRIIAEDNTPGFEQFDLEAARSYQNLNESHTQ